MPDSAMVRKQVRSAMSASLPRATFLSQSCYVTAREAKTAAAAEACVVFDEAALYSQQVSASRSSGYFSSELVRLRQSGILTPFVRDPQKWLDELRRVTLAHVLSEVRRASEPPPGPPTIGETAEPRRDPVAATDYLTQIGTSEDPPAT